MEQRFTSAVALAYQLSYSRQGEKVDNNGYTIYTGNFTDQQIINLDYVNLPIMLRVRPSGEHGFIEVGGQVGYLIGNRFRLKSQSSQITSIRHTQPIDLGLTGGFGYRLGKHIVLDARYYYGMKSIKDDFVIVDPTTGSTTVAKTDKWYNRVYLLNLSYYFR